ncbi:MAG: hypothetical protein FJZ49_08390 [Candidatus Verstraetearchaeota archaeon]|nr:hypothetical protein [Candidatus Verstraetearchaeota archaeon]
MKSVKVSLKDKIVFEVSARDRTDVELKVSDPRMLITVKLCATSLSELVEGLHSAVERLLEELKDPSYVPVEVKTNL